MGCPLSSSLNHNHKMTSKNTKIPMQPHFKLSASFRRESRRISRRLSQSLACLEAELLNLDSQLGPDSTAVSRLRKALGLKVRQSALPSESDSANRQDSMKLQPKRLSRRI